jgi:hypothetical protein
MTTPNISIETARAIHKKGARYVVFAVYNHGSHRRGEIVSWHKAHETASRAAGSSQFLSVYPLADIEVETGMGDFGPTYAPLHTVLA